MTRKFFTGTSILAASLMAFTLVGCDDSQKPMDTDPEAPQPPPEDGEVNSAKTDVDEVEIEMVVVSTPDFDVNTLPGIAGRSWQETCCAQTAAAQSSDFYDTPAENSSEAAGADGAWSHLGKS